jgi:transketolase
LNFALFFFIVVGENSNQYAEIYVICLWNRMALQTPIAPSSDLRLPRNKSLSKLDRLCIDTIRCLAMDAVQKAKSGHPGMPMGMAPAGYLLWTEYLRHNPRNPEWINRDRFVLSAGHGCMLLYSLLHLTGYDLSLEEIKNFRQWESLTPGHPEYGRTPGVEATTGPLGQGISNSVGMAIAGKYLAARYNRQGFPVIDYKIYVFAGDGCLEEGISSEASSLAGHLSLDNLIVVYDDNRITIDGPTSLSFSEDVSRRYEAYGWFVQTVDGDGENLDDIRHALDAAWSETNRPSLIRLKTHIAFGSPHKQDTAEAHGSPLGDEEIALTKLRYGWDPEKKFYIPPEAQDRFREQIAKGEAREKDWNEMFERYTKSYPGEATEIQWASTRQLPADWPDVWSEVVPTFEAGTAMATREAQGKILDALMPRLPLVLGGSADLTPSNNTRFKGVTDFSASNPSGRYIRYGVREHAMGAIMNGIALSGVLIPYGATFFCFSDYMRPSIRLAALSGYPCIFVFTHDSIGLGEDGPTHQAVEHLAALRAMPGLIVIRPADANETAFAWKYALENRKGPTAIALTRQKIPVFDRSRYASAENLYRGAYVLAGARDPQLILMATGSEVSLALEAYETLTAEGVRVRLVSMPSWELFDAQPEGYRNEVFPPSVEARVAVEAAVKLGWERFLGRKGEFIGMNRFGASAPVGDVFRGFGITTQAIIDAARKVLA